MTVELTPEDVRRFRVAASGLHERVDDDIVRAAYAGLQDSAPRAALLSLHARVGDATPESWEDPALAQIWFRGGADYVVPRADLGVFTLGASSRDPGLVALMERVADDVHRVLDGRTLKTRDVFDALPQYDRGMAIRAAAPTGRLLIRWDASSIWLIGVERPDVDIEEARTELLRRFVRWFGPVTMKRFAWWTGLGPRDVRPTWKALLPELIGVECFGEERFVLDGSLDHEPPGATGVRFVPHGDPLIKIDPEIVPDEARRLEVFPNPKTKTSFWPVAGALLVGGEFAGSWARQQRRVTVNLWRSADEAAIEREALSLPVPGRGPREVRFHLESVGR